MAAGKIFAISFAVNAVMGGTFAATMGQSAAAIGRLQDKTRELKAEQKRLDSAWQQSQAAARQYAQTVTRLHAQMQAGNLSESQYHAAVAAAAQKMNAASMSASTYRESLRSCDRRQRRHGRPWPRCRRHRPREQQRGQG